MKARLPRRDRASERRRKLAEINLLTEPRGKLAPARRGCALPFLSMGGTILLLGILLRGHGL